MRPAGGGAGRGDNDNVRVVETGVSDAWVETVDAMVGVAAKNRRGARDGCRCRANR